MSEFKRNLRLGWRNILKNKFFSFLNIGGVAIGIAVTTLILFWVVDELSFDKFNANLGQMYQVYEHQEFSDGQDLRNHRIQGHKPHARRPGVYEYFLVRSD
jgi:hypothetical protein